MAVIIVDASDVPNTHKKILLRILNFRFQDTIKVWKR